MPNRQKIAKKMAFFGLYGAKKSRKIKNIKNLVDDFLQTISESMCTEFHPIWAKLPEVISTFMHFLGAKNHHRKYKGFRPMVKTLPYVFKS